MAKGNWRDDLDKKLLGVLKRDGIKKFLELATCMLGVNAEGDPQMKAQFVGEVCECVFWGLLQKYIEVTGVEAKLFHSVVLKDLQDTTSKFRTELDFVLVSRGFLLTTECKSYAGDITITDKCTFNRKRGSSDIWRQSVLHHSKLYLYAEQLVKPRLAVAKPPVFANVFLFANGSITDKRSDGDRASLTVLTTSSIFDYYDRMFSRYRNEIYDYERACKIFKLCSASRELHRQHGEFVGYND